MSPSDNPYAPPAAAAPRASAGGEPLHRLAATWLGLGLLNGIIGALFFAMLSRILSLDVVGVAVGFGAAVAGAAALDHHLRQRGRLGWSRALRRAALIKAGIQVAVIPDMILGMVAVGAANRLLGPGHLLATTAITVLYGALVYGFIGLIAALVHVPQRQPSTAPSPPAPPPA